MSKKTEPALTPEQAINEYFGGIKGLEKQGLPFTCKCGAKDYPVKDDDGTFYRTAMMSLPEMFIHIRKDHKERIRKPKTIKFEQTTI